MISSKCDSCREEIERKDVYYAAYDKEYCRDCYYGIMGE